MLAYFYHPQLTDTTKRYNFSADPLQAPPVEIQADPAIQTTDTTKVKKNKKDKKKDKKDKKEEAQKTEKEKKDKKEEAKKKEKSKGEETLSAKKDSIVASKPGIATLHYPFLNSDTNSKIFSGEPKSFFTSHELQAKKINAPIPISQNPFWISAIVLLIVIAFVWIRTSYGKRFSRTVAAFINIREFFQLVREEYSMTNGLSVILSIIYILSASLFIYQINSVFHIFAVTIAPFLYFLSIAGVISVVFLLKLFLVRLIGSVFYNKSDQAMPFVYNIFLTNNVIGLILLPVAILLAYVMVVPRQAIIYCTIAIIFGLYIYRIFRALTISTSESGVSNLYFFSYLCTLDFIPFIVLLKQLDTRF